MKIAVGKESFNKSLHRLKDQYRIYAPVAMAYKGTFSDTDSIRYREISTLEEIEFSRKSHFSPKETLLPITQVLFYFTEDQYKEPEVDQKKALVFLRACDIHAVKRIDQMYLGNGEIDHHYRQVRDTIKFILIGCEKSYQNCFCASMGTNKTEEYSLGIKPVDNEVLLDIKDEELEPYFSGKEKEFKMDHVTTNEIKVSIPKPKEISRDVAEAELWREYDDRCVACGKCNFVCSTCTCFSMQDIFYQDNENNGERRRVWASCHVDGYTDMAGGHSFRKKHGDRMRYKVLHKVYDFNKRFGYHMCVGCGRCDDACPQYISFSTSINKLKDLEKEEQ